MVNRVHGNTTSNRPLVSLDAVLVVSSASLQDGLVSSPSTGAEANHRSAAGGDGLLRARGQADAGDALISVLGDNDSIVARGTSHLAAIANLGFDIADDGTFGDFSSWKDVTNSKTGYPINKERIIT